MSERTIVSTSELQNLSPCIFKPLLGVATSIDGNAAQINGQPDFLIKEDQSYVVRNLTLARKISNLEHSESNTVLQLHGWLLSQVTGKPPIRLELQTSDGQIHVVTFDGGYTALKRITELSSIRNFQSKPYSPIGWTKCQGCAYQSDCWTAATERKDVALLIGVDQKLSRMLRRLGCNSIEMLAENFDTSSLANLQKVVGEKFVRVGTKQAQSILHLAKAMIMQTHLTTNATLLPKAEQYAVLDFEGLPLFATNTEFVFLWGMRYFGTDSGSYTSALSLNFERDNDMRAWFEFLQNSEKVFQAYGDIPFFHWHHYERTKLTEYIEKYGDSQNIGSRIIGNLVDLLPLVQDSIALPIPSYSLKVVEKYIGFERQQQPFGGEWVMAKYLEYVSASNSEVKDLCLQQILKYNEEDICATSAVLDWVRQNSEPVDFHHTANDQMT